MPIALFVGKKDPLAVPADARWTRDHLKSVISYKEYENYDHNSFIFPKTRDLYGDLIQLVNKYNRDDKVKSNDYNNCPDY